MISKIQNILPEHNIKITESKKIFIIDYKNLNGGEVELLEEEPDDIKFVFIENIKPIKIAFDGFKDNALPIKIGEYSRQCECVLFPELYKDNNWILFIETKYANNLRAAFNDNSDYPNNMIEQITETVKYFREKKIIPENKRVSAIVSFPNLIEEFNSFFNQDQLVEILLNQKILIRATNSAIVISEKRIRLNSI